MDRLRLTQILAADGDEPIGRRLCRASVEFLGVTGAGVAFMEETAHRGLLWASDAITARVEELQYTLGEGPSIDAHLRGVAVHEHDLAAPTVLRWPVFSQAAVELGVRALFAVPVRMGVVRFGTLSLYRTSPGPLSAAADYDAWTMADLLARAILSAQAGVPPGAIASELEALASYHVEVHQATGIIATRLRVSPEEALLVLRARGYAEGRVISEVAADVVADRIDLK